MRPDLGTFLHHDYGNILIDLLEADRGRKPRGPGSNNHHIEFHRLAGWYLGHESLLGQLSTFAQRAAIGSPYARMNK